MKRHKVLLVLLMVFVMGATARAQQTEQAPQQRGGATGQAGNGDVLNLIGVLGAVQQQGGLGPGGRGGGGIGPGTRGGAPANPPQANTNPKSPTPVIVEDGRVRRVQVLTNATDSLNAGRMLFIAGGGAWWTNTALLTRLGLTDDQKLRIERVYESHRQNLVSSKDNLEKEEAQLAKLLEADSLDRTASVAQIYKVVQARGEMEKTNSLMTFEMREVLTRAQWTQLQAQQPLGINLPVLQINPAGAGTPGTRGGGGRGAATPFGAVPEGTPAPAGTGGPRSGRGQ